MIILSLNSVEKQQMQAKGANFVEQFPRSLARSWSNRDLLKIPECLARNLLLVYCDCDQAVPISHGKYIHKHFAFGYFAYNRGRRPHVDSI